MSSNFICPEHALPWEFVTTNGEWSSSGGVDVACCAAGSTCEDSFEDPCTGTSMDFGGGMWAGLFVGILAFCILLSCIDALVKQIEKAALRSDAAVQCEGTLTAAPVESSGEGGSAHYLEWEFHVPPNCPIRRGLAEVCPTSMAPGPRAGSWSVRNSTRHTRPGCQKLVLCATCRLIHAATSC